MARGNRNNDPARDANKRILADRAERLKEQETQKAQTFDIGLDIREPESNADNAAEFLRDEFDKKTFGDLPPTYTRTIYGPDPLLDGCPTLKANIERMGLADYAETAVETLMLKEEMAFADPMMRKGVRSAIARFGKESVANALRQRILKIPSREVEVEAERNDAMIYAQPMEEAVQRYGTPGMAPKFLSERCIGVLGLRGYVIVKDEKGDPVKVGTLIMGEIPIRMAEARRRHYAQESEDNVRSMEESFADTAARAIRDAGSRGDHASVLGRGDRINAKAAGDFFDGDGNQIHSDLTESYLGRDRETGFHTTRQV